MLIRSQDKKTLFNFIQFVNIGEHGKGAAIYVNNLYLVGEYSTAEKALKVLDMIQKHCKEYETEKIYKEGIYNIDMFQMPEDSEV